jgi:hypothetical protein
MNLATPIAGGRLEQSLLGVLLSTAMPTQKPSVAHGDEQEQAGAVRLPTPGIELPQQLSAER